MLKDLGKNEPRFLENFFSKPYLSLDADEIIQFINAKLKGKRLVLLMDDVKYLAKNDVKLIEKLINSGMDLQLIFTGRPEELKKFSLNTDYKDELKVSLKNLSYESACELIKKRIEFFGGVGTEPFKEKILRDIYNKAETPRDLLKLCYDYSVREALRELKEKQIKPIEIKPEPKQVERPGKKEKTSPPEIKPATEEKKEYDVQAIPKEKKDYTIKVIEKKDTSDYKIKKVKR